MKKTITAVASLSLLSFNISSGQQMPAEAAAAFAQAMAALGQTTEQAAPATSIDPKEMRALLPDKDAYPNYKRTKASTESTAMFGGKMTVAKAEFKALTGNSYFSIEYSDIAGLGALAKLATTMHEIDEETEDGFKRTVTLPGGHKATEEYDGSYKNTEIKAFAGERIAVGFEASGMTFEEAKKIFSKIDLAKLAELN